MNHAIRILLVAACGISLAACAKKTRAPLPDGADAPARAVAETMPERIDDGRYRPEDLDSDACLRQRVVYFDFDRSEVGAEAQAILACHARYLGDRPSSNVALEGHADERGSREYNLGLGERRGDAVSMALQARGASYGQVSVVSFGEERPNCSSSDESCWRRNRRVEIIYTAR